MMIKVLHNFASLNLGGAESRTMDIFRGMDPSKIKFDFVIYDEGKQYFEDEIFSLGGHIHRITSPRKNIFKHLVDLNKLIYRGGYDAIHSHTSYHSGIVMFLARLHKVPIRIAHARTTGSISTRGYVGSLGQALGKLLIQNFSTKRLAISFDAGEFLFGKSGRFEVVPNAFDLSPYMSPLRKSEAREKLSLSQNRMILGQIGRFETVKNHQFTISLFNDIHTQQPDSLLVLVGDGPLRENLESLVRDSGLQGSVRFVGNQNNVYEWLAAFDLLLAPSLYEGLGVVVIEGQAAGRPVIASSNVPQDTDMGLSLVKYLDLEASRQTWLQEIRNVNVSSPTEPDQIEHAFSKRGFTLEEAIQKHIDVYYGK